MSRPSAEVLTHQLNQALLAASVSEQAAGEAVGKLRLVEDQLATAKLQQVEWDRLLAQVRHALDRSAEFENELRAVKNSRSWRLIWMFGAPVRTLRSAVGR